MQIAVQISYPRCFAIHLGSAPLPPSSERFFFCLHGQSVPALLLSLLPSNALLSVWLLHKRTLSILVPPPHPVSKRLKSCKIAAGSIFSIRFLLQWAKAWGRKAAALKHLGRHADALNAAEMGLKVSKSCFVSLPGCKGRGGESSNLELFRDKFRYFSGGRDGTRGQKTFCLLAQQCALKAENCAGI